MNPFQLLGNEHRLIARVTDAFQAFVEDVAATTRVDRQELDDFVTFFREFTDLGHHDKEETILFPTMVRHGFRWDDGPVQDVRREHDQERYLTRTLRYAAVQDREWSGEAHRHFLSIAREYVEFLRRHMDMENRVLFPEADRRLPTEAKEQIARDFQRFDALRTRDGEVDAMKKLADRLLARWEPKRAEVAQMASPG